MRPRWPVGLAAALFLTPTLTPAQPAKPAAADTAKDQARRLADEGQRLLEAGDFRGALGKLEDADARFPAPTIKIARAEAHEKLGELRAAQALYRRVAGEDVGTSAPAEFRDAQRDAAREADRLEKAIPKIRFVLVGPPPPVLTMSLDGATLEEAIWTEPVRVDPGDHTLIVEMSGRSPETRHLALKQGETRRVEIRAPGAPAAGTPVETAPAAAPARSYLAPGVAFGIGAAGLLTGSIAGGVALSKMGDFRKECGPDLRCPGSFQGELDGARAAGHASTIGFAVAGVGAAMGALLLFLPSGNAKTTPAVSAGVSPFGLAVTGRF